MADSELAPLPRVPRWQSVRRSLGGATDLLPTLDGMLNDFGDTIEMFIGGVRHTILTREPGLVQHILQKNNRNYAKSPFTRGFARYVGHGLLTNEGADWLRQRRLIQPGFHRQRVAGLTGLMQEIIEETLAPLVAQAGAAGGFIDVEAHALMTQLTFRIIARSVFSTALAEDDLQRASGLLTSIQEFYTRTIRQPYKRPWFKLSGQYRKHDAQAAELRALLARYISQRQQANAAGTPPPDDLLQMLLDARYEDTGEPMPLERVVDEALILVVAGHETSANALSWLLYLLAGHPEEAALIRQEAHTTLGTAKPSFAELPQLGRALWAVQETMRLYPPAWMLDRVALADDEYQGRRIAKGTMFSLYLHGLHHDPKHWPAPLTFQPLRFAPEALRQQAPYTYAPFGGGPRLCVGMQFALTEMQLVTLELVRRFDITWPAAPPTIITQPMITLRPKTDFRVRLRQI
ncbi:cytochrome P450 [Hymenobacter sp. ASUV-10]|uniref:Cytochrome P450 n=1 Tax=Hymenobacter aranciens TaxID=3063996 RepID=A0ABT9BIE4_9BACT|nr:cytochrome P450 [Hymenobacter sp. ASUV-10]MDO7876777.1 cytochrome P450 [Hymenobacter sp. ASUV-10]